MIINRKIFDKRFRTIKNQLANGFYKWNDREIVFYINYKNMERIYTYDMFTDFIYCQVSIKLKKLTKQITKNISETTKRTFYKIHKYYERVGKK